MFADIVLPTPVRQAFTYAVRQDMEGLIAPGMRVWIPFGNRKSIGMVVRVHDQKPDFKCKHVAELLDEKPLLDEGLLRLTEFVSQYYYSGWGEVIQAALPAGLNYMAERYVSALRRGGLTTKENAIFDELLESGDLKLEEAEQRWGATVIRKMIASGVLELIETPRLKMKTPQIKAFTWTEEQREKALEFTRNRTGKMYAWINAIMYIMDFQPPLSQRELVNEHGFTTFILNRIEKEGFITPTEIDSEFTEEQLLEHAPERLRSLNAEQQLAYTPVQIAVQESAFQSFLLYGVTGSGKTEVYIHALRDALEMGKGGLILVPEIALTPQTVRRFYEIFGDQIAVMHSRLNDRERYEAWMGLHRGQKKVVIGARSAVFAPVQNLGIIIMDEEHDGSYKQEDPSPRYHAREVAIMRASMLKIPIVLGSATPSMSTLNAVSRKKHILLKLSGRHESAILPEVRILDLRKYKSAMRGPLAVPLAIAVEETIERGEQIILLHNRRGFAAHQQCDSCGHVPECPHCSVSLTYHRPNHSLRCHYCGYSRRATSTCTECNAEGMDHRGTGTQRIEDELTQEFPTARILRMDRDTTARKDAHARILNSFGRGEADILIGTQLVAKGLDFPNVTLVGVVNADTELAFPSYRSAEKMFQLLTQVAGRAGRASKKGTVYLQTRIPDHFALKYASEHDFEGFAREEMQTRKHLFYPPFSRMVHFLFKSPADQKVAEAAEAFTDVLARYLKVIASKQAISEKLPGVSPQGQDPHTRQYAILGPAPSTIFKLHDDFRWESLLKLDPMISMRTVEQLLSVVFEMYEKTRPQGVSTVRINVNVDAM